MNATSNLKRYTQQKPIARLKRLYGALVIAGIALPVGPLNATEIILNNGDSLNSLILNKTNLSINGRVTIDTLQWDASTLRSNIYLRDNSELITKNKVTVIDYKPKYDEEPDITNLFFNITGNNSRWSSYGGFALNRVNLSMNNGAVFQDFGTDGSNAFYSAQVSASSTIALERAMWISQRPLSLSTDLFGYVDLSLNNSRMQVGGVSTRNNVYVGVANNSKLDVGGDFNMNGNAGLVEINSGDLYISGKLNTGTSGFISLQNGSLSMQEFTGAPRNFLWTSGEVSLRGDKTVRLGEGLLSSTLLLDAGKRLNVYSKLELGSGTSLRVTDGILSVPTVLLNGGSLSLTDWYAAPITIDWNSGSLDLVGVSPTHTLQILKRTPIIDSGKALTTDRPVVLEPNQQLSVTGGSLKTPQLILDSSYVSLEKGQLNTDKIEINNYGNLAISGGQLNAQNIYLNQGYLTILNDTPINGKLTFNSGSIYISGASDVVLGNTYMPNEIVLGQGSNLNITSTLVVGAGSSLALAGGQFYAGKLRLQGGSAYMSEMDYARTRLDWRQGNLYVDNLMFSGYKFTQEVPILDETKSLRLNGQFILNSGSNFTINGGSLSASQFWLNGGSLTLIDDRYVSTKLDFMSGTLNLPNKIDVALGRGILSSTMNLEKGQTLNIGGALNIYGGTQLSLAGGTLHAASVNLNGGRLTLAEETNAPDLHWNSGTLNYISNAVIGNGYLSQRTQILNAGRNLEVGKTLTVGRGNNLILDGGTLKANVLALQGGRVNGTLEMNSIGLLQGFGNVIGAIRGGANSSIVASGGMLTLGDGNEAGSYAFAGTLDVGSNQVWLQNMGTAQLGRTTLLGNNAQLHSSDGLELAQGNTLISQGQTSIYGKFANYGVVTSTKGTLSFFDEVSGNGYFNGQMLFRAGFTPGGQGQSASINFGGNISSYDENSILYMDILNGASDRLTGISQLNFNGTLELQFDANFKALPGTTIKLFEFQNFAGKFNDEKIIVQGIDRKLLDLTHLDKDGAISISAVPEPTSAGMFAMGLGLLAWRQRRKKSVEQQSKR